MANEVKRMKVVPIKCTLSEKTTSKGAKIYNLVFRTEGMPEGMSMSAVTFSDTIAAEFEKQYNNEVESEFNVGEYNGSPSYTLNEINGVKKSGFGARGAGYQKDVISEERKAAARVASELMQYADAKALKNPIRGWEKLADEAYAWISKRPSVPEAAGGLPEQKSDDPFPSDADAPVK